jgi:SnoaL-like polyketide cyclase
MSSTAHELVRLHFDEMFNGRDLAVCDRIHAEEYVEHAVAPFGREEPGAVNGPEHMHEVVEWLTAQFPDLHMTIEAIVGEGDTVAVLVLSEGTNLGPLTASSPRRGSASRRGRPTGSGSRTASSPSTG